MCSQTAVGERAARQCLQAAFNPMPYFDLPSCLLNSQAAVGERAARQRLQAASQKLQEDASKARTQVEAMEKELQGARAQAQVCLLSSCVSCKA